jgi:hypothetical protein
VNNAVSKLLFLSLSLEAEFVSLSRKWVGGKRERKGRSNKKKLRMNECYLFIVIKKIDYYYY